MNKKDVFKKELSYIKNDENRKNAEVLISLLPDYFFEIPASSTGKYHPSFSVGEGGLVRHTKAAVRIAYELLNNKTIGGIFSDHEKDLIIVSIIVHDGLKEGNPKQKFTVFDHPVLAANFVKQNKSELSWSDEDIDMISSMIESHMGEWNTNQYSSVVLPLPHNRYQKFVHMCDFLSSRKFLDVKFENNEIVE